MKVFDRKQLGLVGVVRGDDFGVVDLLSERIVVYGFSKKLPSLCWYIPRVELKDKDFEVLITRKDREKIKDGTWDETELICEYANWGEVVALLLHPDFPFDLTPVG